MSTANNGFWGHIKALLALNDHRRPWPGLTLAALVVGSPMLIGAWLGQLAPAIIASMGGLVALYLPQTTFTHRMVTLGLSSFGFVLCFTIGMLSSFNPYFSAATLALTVFLVTLNCRWFSLPPPGSFFFILVACLSRVLPFDLSLIAERTGLLVFGCMGACAMGLLYSLFQLRNTPAAPMQPSPVADKRVEGLILEALTIALFVAGSYLLALLIALENPYWVPISCAAIMQGATYRDVWHRNIHRITGTAIGMVLAWGLFSLHPSPWLLALWVMALVFIIEVLVTRNYGLAVIFITPLTVIFAEAATASGQIDHLLWARLLDITLGSCIGYLGGSLIHHPRLFKAMEDRLRRWRQH